MACVIYGQELTEFELTIIDNNSAVIESSVDWLIEDFLLNGDDNKTVITETQVSTKPTKSFQSPGEKNIRTTTDFDDGWGNIYAHKTELTVEPIVYEEPILRLSWSPLNPTVIETTTFNQSHSDERTETSFKGRIDEVRIDYFNNGFDDVDTTSDGIDDSSVIDDNTVFYKMFNEKVDSFQLKLEATYWDGWEHQTKELIKTLEMSNIPPVASFTTVEGGICVPSYEWSATSTDIDDPDSSLSHEWELFIDQDDEWVLLDSGSESIFTYPFQFEGNYKIVLVSSDADNTSGIKEELFTVGFEDCGATSNGCSGTIKIQNNAWQLIAIPKEDSKVKEYFVDALSSKYNCEATDIIDICSCYFGDEDRFRSYIPGVTKPETSNNFPLIYTDDTNNEITGFWVKTKDFSSLLSQNYLIYEWNSQ
jgi:hypothetical protein